MDVVKIARSVGLDLLTLPSHTSHAMQPLDVSCFKPFKQAFQLLRDVWILQNKSKEASKEVLAKWVFVALEKALTKKNIKSGFCTTGIFPFNPHAMDEKMGPSEFYREVPAHMDSAVGNLHSIDLGTLESLYTVNGTFVSHTDLIEEDEERLLQVATEDNLEVDADEAYDSEAEEDYLNELEATLSTEPQ
jgi:hypothetical protein